MACLCDSLCVQFCTDKCICVHTHTHTHTHTSLFHLYIMPKERSWPTLGGRISDCYLLLDSYWNHLDFVQDTIVNVRNQERDASAIILQTEC